MGEWMRAVGVLLAVGLAFEGGLYLGLHKGKERERLTGDIVRAHDWAMKLAYLRSEDHTNDTRYIQNVESGIDGVLSSIAKRRRYSDLDEWEQDRLQDIKRYRARYPYDGPTNGFVRERLWPWPPHEEAEAFLGSFQQAPERQVVY